ncbi:histidine kinase [Thalassotalea insulae]|uniref:Sensor protein n=1 Tax=Thalassotalea insulae TaxID=2056778 RepID=A0ABQ6GNG0_9GAMM|nr:histidine kinase [Thalassotalea insulae]GLX77411.1 histidine kinase [Thalassotalea insulae]
MKNSIFDRLFNSIIFRIGSMMFLISAISILSMFSSVFISEMADQDALIINHAGSLRKQSYKILANIELLPQISSSSLVKQQQKTKQAIIEFGEKVNAPMMEGNSGALDQMPLKETLDGIRQTWVTKLKPELDLLVEQPQQLTEDKLISINNIIENFVLRLDSLVGLYQQRAENRILLIRMILGISLMVTIFLVVFTMHQISRRIEKPLSELTSSARKIMSGDYTAKTNIQQNDELGLLAETMNKMSIALSQSYGQLENRVAQKTKKLRQTNDTLELLYQTSQLINEPGDSLNLQPITEKLAQITEKKDLDLCLTANNSNQPYEHIITLNKDLPGKCQVGDCEGCLSNNNGVSTSNNQMVMRYPIIKDNINYGVLVCNLDAETPLEAWQHQLFTSITTLIANGLHIRQQNEQSRRITLLNERNVIARELHDSLAQALSYLKFQVSRLQKLRKKSASEEQIEDVVVELKTGLDSAYMQLRELLTTFRLKIDVSGLQQTFLETIQQLNERANGLMEFTLDYQIQNLPLTPNEEIHLMQIAREATQNALKHSKATIVTLSVFADEEKNIHMEITDNGIGIGDDPEKLNHYGLAIIQERSQHLAGDIAIRNLATGGTLVELIFQPAFIKSAATVA